MKKINFKIKNVRLAFTLLIILAFIVLLLYYHFVLSPSFAKSNFTNQMIEIADENENSIFNVQKILLYSSANAISNSKDQSLKDMSICQYTDLSIYIDNSQSSSELTDENSVKELYIDNIVMTSNVDKGTKILNYKNSFNVGKYTDIKQILPAYQPGCYWINTTNNEMIFFMMPFCHKSLKGLFNKIIERNPNVVIDIKWFFSQK